MLGNVLKHLRSIMRFIYSLWGTPILYMYEISLYLTAQFSNWVFSNIVSEFDSTPLVCVHRACQIPYVVHNPVCT